MLIIIIIVIIRQALVSFNDEIRLRKSLQHTRQMLIIIMIIMITIIISCLKNINN